MKRSLPFISLLLSFAITFAQSPRITLFEEFTGENCGPCASSNPALNAKLLSATNASHCIAIKWQVPIPTAPSTSWSLYQTNKAEIDWRYRSLALNGYGYHSWSTVNSTTVSGINSAPSCRFDGQRLHNFGGSTTSDHVNSVSNAMIANAKNVPAPFTINITREWANNATALNLTVVVQASMDFTATGALVLRTVMVERHISFPSAPGSNGEKVFEDVAIKSFPDLKNGTSLPSNWVTGQSQTITLNCPFPSYTRKRSEVAMVCFIQDDGDRRIHQAARADKQPIPYDAKAISTGVDISCGNSIDAVFLVENNGGNAITNMTITPYINGVASTAQTWTGNIAPGDSEIVQLSGVPVSGLVSGSQTFSVNITSINGGDNDMLNNSAKVNFMYADTYEATAVAEDFKSATFPPDKWAITNTDAGPNWFRSPVFSAYNQKPAGSARYDFFSNTVIGDRDELVLPPMNLLGNATPMLSFDYAYLQKNSDSNDKLEIYASKDCGQNWSLLFEGVGPTLATAFIPSPNAFTPGEFDWAHRDIELPDFNHPEVLVKFVTTNDNGNYLYLDNINLFQSQPSGLKQHQVSVFSVGIYPNPTSDFSMMEIKSPVASQLKVTLFNQLGQVLAEKGYHVPAGNSSLPLDLREYPSGVYFLCIDSGNSRITKKITRTE